MPFLRIQAIGIQSKNSFVVVPHKCKGAVEAFATLRICIPRGQIVLPPAAEPGNLPCPLARGRDGNILLRPLLFSQKSAKEKSIANLQKTEEK